MTEHMCLSEMSHFWGTFMGRIGEPLGDQGRYLLVVHLSDVLFTHVHSKHWVVTLQRLDYQYHSINHSGYLWLLVRGVVSCTKHALVSLVAYLCRRSF